MRIALPQWSADKHSRDTNTVLRTKTLQKRLASHTPILDNQSTSIAETTLITDLTIR